MKKKQLGRRRSQKTSQPRNCQLGQFHTEQSSKERVAREETTAEATDVSLEHWGRGAELHGDQVAGLGKYVEATEVTAENPTKDLEGKCQHGVFRCIGQFPEQERRWCQVCDRWDVIRK